jgi:hypothetical protein
MPHRIHPAAAAGAPPRPEALGEREIAPGEHGVTR